MAIDKTKILNFLDKYKVFIVILLLVVYISNPSPITSPQKQVEFGSPGTYKFIQLGGLATGFASVLKFIGPVGLAIGSALTLGPWLINKWVDIGQPQPTIPSWIWVGAFIILALLIINKGKEGRR